MSTAAPCVRGLVEFGLGALAESVALNNEATIRTKAGVAYSIFRVAAVINVTEDGRVLLGDPAGHQSAFDAKEIRVSSGVSESPYAAGIAWQRVRQNFGSFNPNHWKEEGRHSLSQWRATSKEKL